MFDLERVASVCRERDGFQPHLISPENGIKALVEEALELARRPVQQAVNEVHAALLRAARRAAAGQAPGEDEEPFGRRRRRLANADKASGRHSAAAASGSRWQRYPAPPAQVLESAAAAALAEWREEARQMAESMVDMEQEYIAASFFRRLNFERLVRMAAAQQEPSGSMSGGGAAAGGLLEALRQGMSKRAVQVGPPTPLPDEQPGTPRSSAGAEQEQQELAQVRALVRALQGGSAEGSEDFLVAFLEKRAGEASMRQAGPVESWKWQRRLFVLADSTRALYYCKDPGDIEHLRGPIPLGQCLAEDLDAQGFPKAAAKSQEELSDRSKVSLLLRIRSRDGQPIFKDHRELVLRAPNAAVKYMWLGRLKAAAVDPHHGSKLASQASMTVVGDP